MNLSARLARIEAQMPEPEQSRSRHIAETLRDSVSHFESWPGLPQFKRLMARYLAGTCPASDAPALTELCRDLAATLRAKCSADRTAQLTTDTELAEMPTNTGESEPEFES